MLKNTPVSPTLDLSLLAASTERLSGSDLQELCRNAAMHPLKEIMRREGGLDGLGTVRRFRYEFSLALFDSCFRIYSSGRLHSKTF